MSTSEHILLALETENKYGNGFISNMKFRNNWKNNNNMQIERLYKNNPFFFIVPRKSFEYHESPAAFS